VKDTEIIEELRSKLAIPIGRHLYAVLGSYSALDAFAHKLQQAKTPDGRPFPKPVSVNRGILDAIPDDEFRQLAADEAKWPEPAAAQVARAFDKLLRSKLSGKGLVVLANLEMVFAYHVDLSPLRTMTTDANRALLLLPGKREAGRVLMFPELDESGYVLPVNLIAENHLFDLRN